MADLLWQSWTEILDTWIEVHGEPMTEEEMADYFGSDEPAFDADNLPF